MRCGCSPRALGSWITEYLTVRREIQPSLAPQQPGSPIHPLQEPESPVHRLQEPLCPGEAVPLPLSPSFGGEAERARRAGLQGADSAPVPACPGGEGKQPGRSAASTAPDSRSVPRRPGKWTKGPRAALLGCRVGPSSRVSLPQSLLISRHAGDIRGTMFSHFRLNA